MKQAGKDWKWFIRMHSTEVSTTTPQKKDGVGNSTPHLSRGYPHTRTILKRLFNAGAAGHSMYHSYTVSRRRQK